MSIQLSVPENKVQSSASPSKFPSIILHALDLQLVTANLTSTDENIPSLQAEEFRYNKRDQTCEIIFSSDCDWTWIAGKSHVLSIEFYGILNDQMRGLYRSSYVGLDGSSHTMATTQFEPTDARRAFPCFDEPALKATFCLKVTIPRGLECISNTPTASVHTNLVGEKLFKTITYQQTPKMSTYLLALVVGEFDGISRVSGGIQTTVYTVPGKAAQGQFCLDVAVECLDLYQKLFDIPYPLAKSDLLAIPDFAAGAMENWGCVTYREAKVRRIVWRQFMLCRYNGCSHKSLTLYVLLLYLCHYAFCRFWLRTVLHRRQPREGSRGPCVMSSLTSGSATLLQWIFGHNFGSRRE